MESEGVSHAPQMTCAPSRRAKLSLALFPDPAKVLEYEKEEKRHASTGF